MKVSIITSVWNNKNTIEDAIKSVLSQDYNHIKYIKEIQQLKKKLEL